MPSLNVTVLKDGDPFISGDFDVRDEDYTLVSSLLSEVDMTKAQAASLLAGYMHAREVGNVTEEMGKLAMLAAVFVLEAGDTAITIPLEQSAGFAGQVGP